MLISPNLRALVTGVAASSPYLLDISLPGLLVRGVYVPPSLSAYQLKMVLDVSFSGRLLIVGDINTRFGATFGDSTSGPRDRMDEVEFLCQKWSLSHLRSSSGLTRVDHAFASHPLRATLHCVTPPVRTDHPSLLSVHVNYADRGYDASGVRRFNLKYLSDPVACRLLADTFVEYALPLFRSIHFIRENLGKVRSVPDR